MVAGWVLGSTPPDSHAIMGTSPSGRYRLGGGGTTSQPGSYGSTGGPGSLIGGCVPRFCMLKRKGGTWMLHGIYVL